MIFRNAKLGNRSRTARFGVTLRSLTDFAHWADPSRSLQSEMIDRSGRVPRCSESRGRDRTGRRLTHLFEVAHLLSRLSRGSPPAHCGIAITSKTRMWSATASSARVSAACRPGARARSPNRGRRRRRCSSRARPHASPGSVEDHAAIRRLVLVRTEAHEQVVDLLIDRRIVEELRRALLRLRIAGAQDAERSEQVE